MTTVPQLLPASRRVIVVVFPGVQTLDATGPAEVFATATRLAAAPRYRVILASVNGGAVTTSAGFDLATRRLATIQAGPRDTVLVAGGDESAIGRAAVDRQLRRWLVRAATRVERIGSVCSGAFVLAAAGLLDGRRAATHWAGCDRLAAMFPAVTVDPRSIFVNDGRVWTSAGVTTGIDMALAMVESDHGRQLVDATAARLVLYVRRPGFQAQWSPALVAQRDGAEPLGGVLAWARGALDRPLDVDALARRAGMSVRTFHRRCVDHLGTTPAKLVAQLRIERARTLLQTSALSAKEIAAQCGLRDGAQLARLCRRSLGVAPRELRALFARPAGDGRPSPRSQGSGPMRAGSPPALPRARRGPRAPG